jgi:hypothetical protein
MRGHAEFKELPVHIAPDIQRVIRGIDPRAVSLSPTRRYFAHLEPSAYPGKPGFNRLSIHMFDFEDRPEQAAQPVQPCVPVGFE